MFRAIALFLFLLASPAYASSTVTLNVTGMATGSVSANGLGANFTNPSDTVFSSSNWGTTAKYLGAQTGSPAIAITTGSSRDQEITSWARNGAMLLRLDGNGGAYFCTWNEDTNSWTIGYGVGYSVGSNFIGGWSGVSFTSGMQLASGSLSSIPGFNGSNTAGMTYTCGVSGVTVYLKYGGTVVKSVSDFRHGTGGTMVIQTTAGYGFRDSSFTFLDQSATYSDLVNNVFDVRDFGLKTLTATGSMSAASTTLTLTSNPGFVIGDHVIVETGGESGAGAQGTLGVGGAWPNLHYANYATLSATTPANGTYAYTDDTLTVYYYYNGWTAALSSMATLYYNNRTAPKALRATITNVSGNVLTLDTASAVATTNAKVYFDNQPVADAFYGNTGTTLGVLPSSWSVSYPAGTYAFGAQQWITASNFTLKGQGSDYAYFQSWAAGIKASPPSSSFLSAHQTMMAGSGVNAANTYLKSPKGVEPAGINVTTGSNVTMQDFGVISNFRFVGFGLSWAYGGQALGLNFQITNGLMQRISFVDASQSALSTQYATNVWCIQCAAAFNDGHLRYTQWAYDWTNSTGGGAIDPVLTSPYIIAGFECFVSYSCSYIRPLSINGGYAINSAGGWSLEEPTAIITPSSQYSNDSWSSGNPIFDINTNIWNTSQQAAGIALGGVVKNPYIWQSYAIDGGSTFLKGINTSSSVANVFILGDYYALNGGTTKGKLVSGGGNQINNDIDANIYVNGIRVTTGGGINNNGPTSQSVNCIADTITGTARNCKTNSAWVSGGGN